LKSNLSVWTAKATENTTYTPSPPASPKKTLVEDLKKQKSFIHRRKSLPTAQFLKGFLAA